MSTISEVQKLALDLSVADRAVLAAQLLRSLPPILDDDDDEGIAEALRREAEFRANPEIGLTFEEFDRQVREQND